MAAIIGGSPRSWKIVPGDHPERAHGQDFGPLHVRPGPVRIRALFKQRKGPHLWVGWVVEVGQAPSMRRRVRLDHLDLIREVHRARRRLLEGAQVGERLADERCRQTSGDVWVLTEANDLKYVLAERKPPRVRVVQIVDAQNTPPVPRLDDAT